MSGTNKNHYELLGVPRDAPVQVIKDTYKELARIFHPDSHFFDDILEEAGMGNAMPAAPAPTPESEETFKLITDAYTTLINAARRTEYDATLPRETPDWDTDSKEAFELDQKQRQFENPSASQPYSWGSFGAVEQEDLNAGQAPLYGQGNGPRRSGAMTQEDIAYKSVSEMIKQQNSLSAKLRRFFGI